MKREFGFSLTEYGGGPELKNIKGTLKHVHVIMNHASYYFYRHPSSSLPRQDMNM